MVFGLCRGAWPYKGPCTAGGKLAAEALRVLKKSIQHAGARKARLGRRPLIPTHTINIVSEDNREQLPDCS